MSTLCTEVQELVSSAFDGEVTDREAIVAAKAHCATCAQCASFVAFLGAARDVAEPAAPEAVIVRVLDIVREEAAQHAEEAAKLKADATATTRAAAEVSPPVPDPQPIADRAAVTRITVRGFNLEWQRAMTPWYAAAAVLAVAAVLVTAQGVSYIMNVPSSAPSLDGSSTEALVFGDAELGSSRSGEDWAADDTKGAGEADTYSLGAPLGAQGPESTAFVAFGEFAYRLTGDATPPQGAPTGTLTSSLDAPTPPQRREVYAGPGPRDIVIDAGEGRFLQFQRAERSLGGRTFALTAEQIDSFDEPVGLPRTIPSPTDPNGWPTFVPGGTDDAGVEVFVRPGADPSAGFALAPGEAGSEWTWWMPVR